MKKEVAWKKVSHFEKPEVSPGFLLWQVSTEWRRSIENALSKLKITHAQFVLLANIGWLTRHGKEITQVELARQCKTDVTMTSQILRTLEKKGYIKRKQRQGDVKSKLPFLTPSGIKIVEEALPLVEAKDREFFKKLGKDEGKCVRILQKLV